MATHLSRSDWAKFPVFRKNGLFLAQKVFASAFLFQIRNFSQIGQKNKGSSNFDPEQYQKLFDDVILTSY